MNIAATRSLPINPKTLLIGLAMLAAAGLAILMTPTQREADKGPRVDLEKMIPSRFGEWEIDKDLVPISVSPDVQARLDVIYSQTMTRTYRNPAGNRIMLSIAYGGDQSNDKMQVHRPEYCYKAQGFEVVDNGDVVLKTAFKDVPIRRLLAKQRGRSEPISYWITIGTEATLPGWDRKLTQLRYGLTGKVPDGLLFRVSSISPDMAGAYKMQDMFSKQLIDSVDQITREKLIGK